MRKTAEEQHEDSNEHTDTESSENFERSCSGSSERSDSGDEDFKIKYRDGNDTYDSSSEEEVQTKKSRGGSKKEKGKKPETGKKRKKPKVEQKPKRETKKQKTKKEAEETVKNEKSKPTKKKADATKAKEMKAQKMSTMNTKQQKCALFSFYALINDHKEKVPEQSHKFLQGTCLWDFIAAFRDGKIDGLQVRKQESDLEIILSHYNTDIKAFVFSERKMTIEKEQVHSLFHITQEGLDLKEACKGIKNKKSGIFTCEKASPNIKRTQVEDELEWQLCKKKKDAKKIA